MKRQRILIGFLIFFTALCLSGGLFLTSIPGLSYQDPTIHGQWLIFLAGIGFTGIAMFTIHTKDAQMQCFLALSLLVIPILLTSLFLAGSGALRRVLGIYHYNEEIEVNNPQTENENETLEENKTIIDNEIQEENHTRLENATAIPYGVSFVENTNGTFAFTFKGGEAISISSTLSGRRTDEGYLWIFSICIAFWNHLFSVADEMDNMVEDTWNWLHSLRDELNDYQKRRKRILREPKWISMNRRILQNRYATVRNLFLSRFFMFYRCMSSYREIPS